MPQAKTGIILQDDVGQVSKLLQNVVNSLLRDRVDRQRAQVLSTEENNVNEPVSEACDPCESEFVATDGTVEQAPPRSLRGMPVFESDHYSTPGHTAPEKKSDGESLRINSSTSQ